MATLSKRYLKQKRAAQRELQKLGALRQEAKSKAISYVLKWKHSKSEWKFEKIRQIWLIDHLLDETAIPEEHFPIVLEYFEGCKGIARELLLKKGMEVMKKVEDNEANKDEIMDTVAYKRARRLLQAIPNELPL
ncbi:uncharacterized protein C7orf50 homolog [Prorops nasuta]|uniref:uncharacterized protein C7orf50 homolog n=1 Tax=Prorops nasuta TaxID=863751 RepID=UPI0034CF1208